MDPEVEEDPAEPEDPVEPGDMAEVMAVEEAVHLDHQDRQASVAKPSTKDAAGPCIQTLRSSSTTKSHSPTTTRTLARNTEMPGCARQWATSLRSFRP